MDNGFDDACPSGNHMTEGDDVPDAVQVNIEIGQIWEDEEGVVWKVDKLAGTKVFLVPDSTQVICVTEEDLVEYYDQF
jgi:hypothetical protein